MMQMFMQKVAVAFSNADTVIITNVSYPNSMLYADFDYYLTVGELSTGYLFYVDTTGNGHIPTSYAGDSPQAITSIATEAGPMGNYSWTFTHPLSVTAFMFDATGLGSNVGYVFFDSTLSIFNFSAFVNIQTLYLYTTYVGGLKMNASAVQNMTSLINFGNDMAGLMTGELIFNSTTLDTIFLNGPSGTAPAVTANTINSLTNCINLRDLRFGQCTFPVLLDVSSLHKLTRIAIDNCGYNTAQIDAFYIAYNTAATNPVVGTPKWVETTGNAAPSSASAAARASLASRGWTIYT